MSSYQYKVFPNQSKGEFYNGCTILFWDIDPENGDRTPTDLTGSKFVLQFRTEYNSRIIYEFSTDNGLIVLSDEDVNKIYIGRNATESLFFITDVPGVFKGALYRIYPGEALAPKKQFETTWTIEDSPTNIQA